MVFALLMFLPVLVVAQTPQEHVHRMSHTVMPFDMSQTLHVFNTTEQGGVQRVIARDPKALDHVALIQQHLVQETARFQKGDYSDPASLHGADMPGLKQLQQDAAKITVAYKALTDGGEITFVTADLRALTAIHRWFGAQLSEHGDDAKAE
jgi:hypothetical protein